MLFLLPNFALSKGQLLVCHNVLLPQQEDLDLPRGVLHHYEAPDHKVQEPQEEATGSGVSQPL